MPRAAKDINTEPCTVCGKVIRYKSDIPRHNKLHTTNKADLMYKCQYAGCEYQNLQKSNVATHFRTHTGEKPKSCPDCEYTTSDPGSLTRHRKRIHGYVPKERALTDKGKQSVRHSPYTRESSVALSSNGSIASNSAMSSQVEDNAFGVSRFYEQCFPAPLPDTRNSSDTFSYPWDKTLPPTQEFLASASSESFINALPSDHNPHHLSSGVGAGYSLELPTAHSPALQGSFDYLPSASCENFLEDFSFSPKDFEYLSPPNETVSQTNDSWAHQSISSLDTPLPQPWDFTFGSPASSDGSLPYYSPSPSPPSEFSFYDSSRPESADMLDFLFPEPPFGFCV